MPLTVADLFATPDHYLHSFEGRDAVFMPMDRAAYQRSIFLDGRIDPVANQTMKLPISLLPDPSPVAASTFIFHVAHCGSTLLARALDVVDASLVLREPLALRQIAVQHDVARLDLVLAMLGKRYRSDAPTLIKANVPVNFILPELVARNRAMRAIFLYLPLRGYVLAILRSAKHRTWLRNVTAQLAPYLGDLSALTDAELVAALWLAQINAFSAAIAVLPEARALEAEVFFDDPLPVLAAAAARLSVPLERAQLAAIVRGSLFSTYSKNPSLAFDNAARIARRNAAEQAIAPELDAAEAWVARNADSATPLAPLIEAALIR